MTIYRSSNSTTKIYSIQKTADSDYLALHPCNHKLNKEATWLYSCDKRVYC